MHPAISWDSKIRRAYAVVFATFLLLCACNSQPENVDTTTTISTPPTTTATTLSPAASPEPPPSAEDQPQATPAETVDCSQPMPAPTNQFGAPMSSGTSICATVVACADISENYEPGTTHMSDGTLMYTEDCNDYYFTQKAEQQPDPGTTSGRGYTCDKSGCVWPDGSPVPNYQRCGEMCGEPPTSGDIQGKWFECLNSGATEEECRLQQGGN
ncbi:hypothetical protein [Rhodococcus sp. ACS1]|uniref:hypothetical protein n=1 Tax=Rhodococcus sp. ACS1 TaxID=2028570 RepID=UPI00117AD580|nr:hypothetical protein [Rhodococcus sp. ACS1]